MLKSKTEELYCSKYDILYSTDRQLQETGMDKYTHTHKHLMIFSSHLCSVFFARVLCAVAEPQRQGLMDGGGWFGLG